MQASVGRKDIIPLVDRTLLSCNVDASSLVNNNVAFSVASGSVIRASNNNVYNNATNFSIAAGGSILSAGNNRMTPGGATNPSGSIPLQ
jgi:hypothetical protein